MGFMGAAALAAAIRPAVANCNLGKLAELPVTMVDSQPMITATINGTDVLFLADSGAFFSLLSPATAAQFRLRLSSAPYGIRLMGVGGQETDASMATVNSFTIKGLPVPLENIEFLVGGGQVGAGAAGIVGQNVFQLGDVEYDLAKGVIRLMRPQTKDCKKAFLGYWITADQPFSNMPIEVTTLASPHTTGIAFVNGVKIKVMFDTGADASVLSLRAAARAGVKLDTPGVTEAGYSSGIGRKSFRTWVAPFASFKLGDEEIRNTHLKISEAIIEDTDMLIGADFFLSHRIYVASSQHRLYFTYNGGPVFNLATAVAADLPAPTPGEPTTAAEFSQRGNAFASRRDFSHAIADLTRACELAPREPSYFYQRAKALMENQQPIPALADLDHALELKPDLIPALLARAEVRLDGNDAAPAMEDLDAADRASAKEGDARLRMAFSYFRADRLPMALSQLDLWIPSHRDDARIPEALNQRCLVRALSGTDLSKALDDCNTAVNRTDKTNPRRAEFLENRALARLRLGDYDKSIVDYDASLGINPKSPEALYGRGIDKLRRGKSDDGNKDIAAAVAMQPQTAASFEKHGIAP